MYYNYNLIFIIINLSNQNLLTPKIVNSVYFSTKTHFRG